MNNMETLEEYSTRISGLPLERLSPELRIALNGQYLITYPPAAAPAPALPVQECICYQYTATLVDFRRVRGRRYQLYVECETYIGFRHHDHDDEGILCIEGTGNVSINIIFKGEDNCYKFQNAICKLSRRHTTDVLQVVPVLERENIKKISLPTADGLVRIMSRDYQTVGENVSPPFSVGEHSGSLSDVSSNNTEHCQNPKTNPEIILQMIEPIDSVQFISQIAESCHLTPKVSDPNNFLYLSRFMHQHFDGINTPLIGVPTILVHYVTHGGHPEQTVIPHISAYRTTVQIFAREENTLDTFLRYNLLITGGTLETVGNKKAYQIHLFFDNGDKACRFLIAKELETLKIWKRKAQDASFNFLFPSLLMRNR